MAVGGARVTQKRLADNECSYLPSAGGVSFSVYATTNRCYDENAEPDNFPITGVWNFSALDGWWNREKSSSGQKFLWDLTPTTSMEFWLASYENQTWHTTKLHKYRELGWLDHQTNNVQIDLML